MRNVVILSPYFPPSQLAGVHRARLLAKHLPAAGWNPIILCVDEAFHEQRLDPALAQLVPPSTEVIKVGAVPIGLTRPFGVGDITLRAFGALRSQLFNLMTTRDVASVLITSAPYFPLMLAPTLKRQFGAQVVLDFQDPWVSQWGAAQPKWSKAGVAHRLAAFLEPSAVRAADFITSVSETQNNEMRQRYPWLDEGRTRAIPIGGDPADFEALRRRQDAPSVFKGRNGAIELSYVGSYWSAAEGPFRAFLRAVARLKSEKPEVLSRLRFNFVGTDSTLSGARKAVTALAAEHGVAEFIDEIPERLSYLDALAVTARSQGLLLIGSDEPHYTASKIYTSLMSGRPYLSLFHRESSAHAVLTAAGGGIPLSFADRSELTSLDREIAIAIERLALAPDSLGRPNSEAYAPFVASAIARQFADIFERGPFAGQSA